MLHAVIMAGGSGTRFWPVSRRDRPKQFLSLVGEESLLQQTVNRVRDLAPLERMIVVTSKAQVEEIYRKVKALYAGAHNWETPEIEGRREYSSSVGMRQYVRSYPYVRSHPYVRSYRLFLYYQLTQLFL